METEITMRCSANAEDLDLLEPHWGALQAHHAAVLPTLGDRTPPRSHAESWARRRERYERWLFQDETFILLAEGPDGPVGYAFVTVGAGYAGWRTGGWRSSRHSRSCRVTEARTSGAGSWTASGRGSRSAGSMRWRSPRLWPTSIRIASMSDTDSSPPSFSTTGSERGPRGRASRALLKWGRRQSRT